MKAVILQAPGDINQLSIQDVPLPILNPGEVLVKVRCFAINPVDIKTRNGKAQYNILNENPPVILGWDMAGDVIEVGNDVKKFKSGDQVFGMVNFPGSGKAYAEFVAVPYEHVTIKPHVLPYEDAAAASLAALTAWQVLVHQLKIKAGDRILIHAAAGGVGHFAVQFAKYFGAYVIGTASVQNHGFLKGLGVDESIDYNNANSLENISNLDLILDPIGGDTTKLSFELLKPNGKLISIVGGVKEEHQTILNAKNIQASNYLVHSSGEDLEAIVKVIEKGKLKVHVSHVFPFAKIKEAHQQVESGKTKGKVVVNIK